MWCSNNNDCNYGETCESDSFNYVCVDGTCNSDTDCWEGYFCDTYDYCGYDSCTSDNNCNRGYDCEWNECVY